MSRIRSRSRPVPAVSVLDAPQSSSVQYPTCTQGGETCVGGPAEEGTPTRKGRAIQVKEINANDYVVSFLEYRDHIPFIDSLSLHGLTDYIEEWLTKDTRIDLVDRARITNRITLIESALRRDAKRLKAIYLLKMNEKWRTDKALDSERQREERGRIQRLGILTKPIPWRRDVDRQLETQPWSLGHDGAVILPTPGALSAKDTPKTVSPLADFRLTNFSPTPSCSLRPGPR